MTEVSLESRPERMDNCLLDPPGQGTPLGTGYTMRIFESVFG